MDNATILVGFVQISIALAAFTTIAAVIVQISESTSENLLAVRLKTILVASMHLIVLAVLPIVFYQMYPNDGLFWRYAALASSISWVIACYLSFLVILPKVLNDPKNSWTQTLGASVFAIGGLISAVLSLLLSNAAFWYITSLVLILGACLIMVVGLILSFPVFDVHRKQTNAKSEKRAKSDISQEA